jgi:hypothetical protein
MGKNEPRWIQSQCPKAHMIQGVTMFCEILNP